MGMNPAVLIVSVFTFTALVFGLALTYRFREREMQYKQRLAEIEKGIDPELPQSPPWTPRSYLLRGMIWLFVGIASFVALSAVAVTSRRPITVEERLGAVNDARFRGASPEELHLLLNSPREETGIPVGLGFLGFIPIGVGLAYLIFYRVESKKLLS
jgi:hypothetical protein